MRGLRAVASSAVVAGLLGGLASAAAAEAGQGPAAPGTPAAASSSYAGLNYAGPSPPVAPEVISRDGDGRATVRAVRLSEPLEIDGALDEAHYRDVPPFSGFIQIEPRDGDQATEQTQVWISFDDDNIYLSFRCLDSQIDRLVANEMRRDNGNIFSGNDIVAFFLDPYYDRRNGVTFTINALGGRMDGQVTSESQYNGDFNPVWDVKAMRGADAWTVEAVIPFKSLKYRAGQRSQLWGFNVARAKRSKNEISFLTHVSKARGQSALRQASLAATIVGLEVPELSRNLDIKPYVTSNLTTDLKANPQISNDPGGDVGLDVKYGVTQNMTADLTVNTDFAQVEADEQQVNLTRFSLFFPEKRDFFLENQGTFAFGGVAAAGASSSDAPTLFYSRRIGFNRNREVPLEVGGRLTGRAGKFIIGALNMQTGDEEKSSSKATNFSVLRLKRDVLRRSSVGVIFTGRSVTQSGEGTSQAYGADGTFSFFQNLSINTYWAQTKADGVSGEDDASYRAQLDYPGDRYGVQIEHLVIGANFNPEVGFVRRKDMVREFGSFRFSPRPRASRRVRRYSYTGFVDYIENGAGRVETREREGEFAIEFQNADRFSVTYTNTYDFLPEPFDIATGVTLPVGGYDYDNARVAFNMGQQRRLSFNVAAEYGTYYNGHKTTVGASRGRMNVSSQLSIEPTYTVNRVELVEGSFTTHLTGTRVVYTMTPLMFTSALLQYNSGSHAISANVRLRWEYRPGSELFIVFNTERNTLGSGFSTLSNRSLIIKINRLFRI